MTSAFLASGCGNPLVSDSAYDSPLFALHGHLSAVPADAAALRIAVVWVDPEQLRDDVPAPGDTIRTELSGERFEFSLYTPPPRAAIRRLVDPTTGDPIAAFAFGELVAFQDADANDRFEIGPIESGSEIVPPDVYRGAQGSFVVGFVEDPLHDPEDQLPELQGLLTARPGYHLIAVNCDTPAAPFTRAADAEAVDIGMTIFDTGSAQLPFLRPCLRSHPSE